MADEQLQERFPDALADFKAQEGIVVAELARDQNEQTLQPRTGRHTIGQHTAGVPTLFDKIATILARGGMADAVTEAMRIVHAAEISAPADHEQAALAMAEHRAGGAPLDYVIGQKVFMGVNLIVAEGALVPREETEILGHAALDAICNSDSRAPMVIDMCCGSGNLACAIAHHSPTSRVWASDLTDSCIDLARRNVEHMRVSERVTVVKGDLFAGLAGLKLEGLIDVVVCNPPYISQNKLATHRAGLLAHEPREAFDGGPYGLSIHQRVINEALPFLRAGGALLLEVGLGQGRQAKMLFERTKKYEGIRMIADTTGEVRVVSGCRRA